MNAAPVLILDFGSQYTQLIARRIRQLQVYCEILPWTTPLAELQARAPAALVLSGGPASVLTAGGPDVEPALWSWEIPILAICYGQQLMAARLGGQVRAAERCEYGRAQVRYAGPLGVPADAVFAAVDAHEHLDVWMSHGDHVEVLPPDFVVLASTAQLAIAAMGHRWRPWLGLQFHPEVAHTPRGMALLEGFLFGLVGLAPSWTMAAFLETQVAALQAALPAPAEVICGLSGGVDSSVVAALLGRAIGPRLHCIMVDNGLLRTGEVAQVASLFGQALALPLHLAAAGPDFLAALLEVEDPEQKRKIIGAEFIRVFETAARRLPAVTHLAQGTLYPDVIESAGAGAGGALIKSHHNVGGLPERMQLALVEPVRDLFKDEVRLLGAALGLPDEVCQRQPFPGPGLAVRIAGAVTSERLRILRQADAIVEVEMRASGLYENIWQSFAILLPIRSVGVRGDARAYDQTICLRCVDSVDGMTADWSRLPHALLDVMSRRILNEVRGVGRVLYDISSKPPGTIEWE